MHKYQRNHIYMKAIKKYGEASQLNMVKEELAELIVAISHYDRGRIGGLMVFGEIADVYIMLEQLRLIINN